MIFKLEKNENYITVVIEYDTGNIKMSIMFDSG